MSALVCPVFVKAIPQGLEGQLDHEWKHYEQNLGHSQDLLLFGRAST